MSAEFLRTARISRGHGPAWHFGSAPRDISGITFTDIDGATRTVAEMLANTYTDGFLVAQDGKIVAEIYMNGMERASTLHLSQSVVKSFTGALRRHPGGAGRTRDRSPGLRLRAGAGAVRLSRRHAARRCSTCAPASSSARITWRRTARWRCSIAPPAGSRASDAADTHSTKGLILTLQQERPHGGSFLYRSIETEVLGWIVSKVTGQDLATFMSNALWQPMGAEADGAITIDDEGTALADGGLNATLRDYARFGQLFLDRRRARHEAGGAGILGAGLPHRRRRGLPRQLYRAAWNASPTPPTASNGGRSTP